MPYWTDYKFPTHDEMVALLHSQENIFEPETKLKYSNLGMAILGEVVFEQGPDGKVARVKVEENFIYPKNGPKK